MAFGCPWPTERSGASVTSCARCRVGGLGGLWTHLCSQTHEARFRCQHAWSQVCVPQYLIHKLGLDSSGRDLMSTFLHCPSSGVLTVCVGFYLSLVMEPTASAFAAVVTLDSIADWAGCTAEQTGPQSPRGSWMTHLGSSTQVAFAIITGIGEEQYKALVSSGQTDDHAPTTVQLSMVGFVWDGLPDRSWSQENTCPVRGGQHSRHGSSRSCKRGYIS